MIKLNSFHKLRLRQLLPDRRLSWSFFTQYLDRRWIGHSYIFTDCLQPINRPFQTHSVSIELGELSEAEVNGVFLKLDIPVTRATDIDDIQTLYGDPVEVEEFNKDRKTLIYHIEGIYEVCFTVFNEGGMAFFNMNTLEFSA